MSDDAGNGDVREEYPHGRILLPHDLGAEKQVEVASEFVTKRLDVEERKLRALDALFDAQMETCFAMEELCDTVLAVVGSQMDKPAMQAIVKFVEKRRDRRQALREVEAGAEGGEEDAGDETD